MKVLKIIIPLIVVLFCLSSCDAEKTLPEQIQELYGKLETDKLPVRYERENIAPRTHEGFFIKDDTSDLLAEKVQRLLTSYGNTLGDFDDITKVTDIDEFKYLALLNTPCIENPSLITSEYPNHILTQFMLNQREEGRETEKICYASDVTEKIICMFGDKNEYMVKFHGENNIHDYSYFLREDIFTVGGVIAYSFPEPQIISYEKNGDEYICEAVIIPSYRNLYLDNGESVIVTEDNYMEYESYFPKYR